MHHKRCTSIILGVRSSSDCVKMGDKSLHYHHGPRFGRTLFYSFILMTLLCIASWFLFIGSARHDLRNNSTVLDDIPYIFRQISGEGEGSKNCDHNQAVLKVFMYDLPYEFHFGLLGWKPEDDGAIWPNIQTRFPEYAGGLNLQHSIEYWLTLDLLSSTLHVRRGACTAVRVQDYREADVVFVPFFSSLSFNRHSKPKSPSNFSTDRILQDKLVKFLTSQEVWKRSRGHDHIILAHHPNSFLYARVQLWPCMFILADFGRYSSNVANIEKDLIAPYKHVIETYSNDSSSFDDRPILLYFQGAIYRKDGGFIRQELFYLLKDEKDVHFSIGAADENGIKEATKGMQSSKFCLTIAGDTPSSNRLFDAIASNCIPLIISDDIELPFEDVLDYSEFCIFMRSSDAVKKGFLIKMIKGISREKWTQMSNRLKEVKHYFEFQYPSQKDDAVQMIWQAVARKVPSIRLKLHRSGRFSRYKHMGVKSIFPLFPRRHYSSQASNFSRL